MPKLCEVTGGTKTKICFQGIISQRCILAVLQIIKLDLTKAGNRGKPLKYSEKKKIVFCVNLGQMFKHMATNLNISRQHNRD
jgi:hypothetical protein